MPAEVPRPRHGLPARLPGRPDRLQRQRRLHELVDGAHPATKTRRSRASSATRSAEAPGGAIYVMAPARDEDGDLVLLLVDDTTGRAFVGTREGLEPTAGRDAHARRGGLDRGGAGGLRARSRERALALDQRARPPTRCRPTGNRVDPAPRASRRPLSVAPTLRYVAGARRLRPHLRRHRLPRQRARARSSPRTARSSSPAGARYIGCENFTALLHRPARPRPVHPRLRLDVRLRACSPCFGSFALGLFLAIALNHPKMRMQRIYRSLLVIPYAIPALPDRSSSGQGLLNDDFGVVNSVLHLDVPVALRPDLGEGLVHPRQPLADASPTSSSSRSARCSRSPASSSRRRAWTAAAPWRSSGAITLPLLLVAVAPLLIASFAFNFNNFNTIYLLTGGGPPAEDQSVAGATDILISYTYKLAFEAGKGQDYGLASAISIFIFFIVAGISAVAFWRTKSLENLRMSTIEAARARRRGRAAGAAHRRGARAAAAAGADWWRHLVAHRRDRLRASSPSPTSPRPRSTPTGRSTRRLADPARRHARQLPHDPLRRGHRSPATPSDIPYPRWYVELGLHPAGHGGALQRLPRRARGLRVQPLPLPRPAHGDAGAAADPDVPAAARGRRDLPDRAPHRRRLPVARPQHVQRR